MFPETVVTVLASSSVPDDAVKVIGPEPVAATAWFAVREPEATVTLMLPPAA